MISASYAFMAFSLVLVTLGIVGRYLDNVSLDSRNSDLDTESVTPDSISRTAFLSLSELLKESRAKLVEGRAPKLSKIGILSPSANEFFHVPLESGECNTILALVLPGDKFEVTHGANDVDHVDVTVDGVSADGHYRKMEVCTGVEPASVTFTITTRSSFIPFVVESYFSRRDLYDPDGTRTPISIVDPSQLKPVRPPDYEKNQEYTVHVYSDGMNRGVAARAFAMLQEHGFNTIAHLEPHANMVGWNKTSSGIVAGTGEGTAERGLAIREVLRPIVAGDRLTLYKTGKNPGLVTMDGKLLGVFVAGN